MSSQAPSGHSLSDILSCQTFLALLHSRLINKLQPKSVAKITTKGGGFALRENVSAFCNAARKYGVPDSELFQTVDLFEKKNIPQVTLSIHSLGRQAQAHNFAGPTLGIKLCEKNERHFTEEQLAEARNTVGLLSKCTTVSPLI
jgi:hypothetical protein